LGNSNNNSQNLELFIEFQEPAKKNNKRGVSPNNLINSARDIQGNNHIVTSNKIKTRENFANSNEFNTTSDFTTTNNNFEKKWDNVFTF
jgi:hypothetical protein